MVSKTALKKGIKKLIYKYESMCKNKSSYSEADVQTKLIKPLFGLLEWDVEGDKDPNEVKEEVNLDEKRADLTFKYDLSTKLVVENKNLLIDIHSKKKPRKDAVLQANINGNSANVSCTVLTNFEYMIFIDSQKEYDNPEETVIWELNYNDFLKESGLTKLLVLSKEGFKKNRWEEELQQIPGHRIPKKPVDKEVLLFLLDWRQWLYEDIKEKYKQKYSNEKIDEMIQVILNRFMFIRKCECKGFIQKTLTTLRHELKNDKLEKLFSAIEGSYDGLLFKKHECDKIKISKDVMKKIIKELYWGKEGKQIMYNYAVIPSDILGKIYEQYLGHILKYGLEEFDSKRDLEGIYFTRKYLVDYMTNISMEYHLRTGRDISNIKVLDPSCGSGSFLVDIYEKIENYYSKKKKLNYEKKCEIATKYIAGVDLDIRAIEIARLNLYFKLLEKNKKLPILDNIKEGNSVIETGIKEDKPFKWNSEFKDILSKGGFDMVIGNPPYINAIKLSKIYGKQIKEYWKNRYDAARGTYDIYILFFEQALNICKENGLVCFITPNKYLSSSYGKALRNLIASNYKLVRILDLSRVKVFEDPSVYPIVTIIQKTKHTKDYKIITERFFSEDMRKKTVYLVSSKLLKLFPDYIWGNLLSNNMKLIEKIFGQNVPLNKIAKVNATSTVSEADEYFKHISDKKGGQPLISTGTIDRYSTTYGIKEFSSKGKKLIRPLLDLSKVKESRKKLYKQPKIIIAKLASKIEAFLDQDGSYASINTNCVHSPSKTFSLEFLTGILNSKLMSFFYLEIFSGLRMAQGFFQFQSPQLRILPIAKPSKREHEKITKLVKKIIALNTKLKNTQTKESIEKEIKRLDLQIDKLVYKLYDLTENEMKIIEDYSIN